MGTAFTGCDTVSFFCWKRKEDSLGHLENVPRSNPGFLGHHGQTCNRRHHRHTPKICCIDVWSLQYTHNGGCSTPDIVCKKQQQAALRQHILRTVLQSGHVWWQNLEKDPYLPSPAKWGWQRKDTSPWMPIWTTLEPAQDACKELIKCGCEQGCRGRCSCRKANLPSTALCFCSGDCSLED